MKGNQQHTLCAGQSDQLRDLGGGYGDGLVDDHILARLQHLLRHIKVTAAGRGHHDDVDRAICQQIF